jgi:hypothetical protein
MNYDEVELHNSIETNNIISQQSNVSETQETQDKKENKKSKTKVKK